LHLALPDGNLNKSFKEMLKVMGASKKQRIEIPKPLKVEVLFASDRTCCVCRVKGKPTQIHHIDENPANNAFTNLAVLCFDCHNLTQVRGGFHNKLDAAQVIRYRDDWLNKVSMMRETWWRPTTDAEAKENEKLVSPTSQIHSRSEAWEASIVAKLKEFTFIWNTIYGKKPDKMMNPFIGDLQNKFFTMSDQLIILLSKSPKGTSDKMIEDIGSIANKLSELATKQFYLDGGKSVGEFNDLGDGTSKIAKSIVEQTNANRDDEELA